MLYMEGEQLYSFVKMVLILRDRGLRRNSLPSLTSHLAGIHLERVVLHSMQALVYLRTSSKPWAGGLPKLGRYTFAITLLYVPNYNSQLSAFASVINNSRLLTFIFLHHLHPPALSVTYPVVNRAPGVT